MSGKSIKKNYIYNVIYQLLVILIPLITAPYISRVLGAEGIGTYSYAVSIASYFTMTAALGTSAYGQRQISFCQDNDTLRNRSFWNVEVLRIFCTVLSSVMYLLYVEVFHRGDMIYAVLTFHILQVALDVSWLFQGMEDFGRITGRNIAIRVLQMLYTFLFVKDRSDLVLYAFGMAVFPVLGAFSMWPYLKKYVHRPEWKNLTPGSEFKSAFALFVPTIAVSIYTILDKTMIGLFSKDGYENGYYEQAMKISKMVLVIVTSLGTVLVPRIGFYHKQKQYETVRQYMYRSYRFVWMLGIPMCVGMILVAPKIVPWFYGDGFEKATGLIQIMSLLIVFIGVSNVTGIQYFLPTEREKLFTASVSIGAAINFILNLILIPYFYSVGAAIASVTAEAVIAVIQIVWVRKELSPGEIIYSARKYAMAGAVMGMSLYVESKYLCSTMLHSLILIGSGIFIYVLLLYLMKDEFFMKQAGLVLQRLYRAVSGDKG